MSRNGKKDSYELDTSSLPALPAGWRWMTLEAVADIEGGITKDQKRPRTATMREVPYLRVANVQRGYLDLAETKTILAEEEEVEALRLQRGDILFTEGGDRDKLGRGWVWNGEIEDCIHQNHIFRARPFPGLVDPKFVSFHGNYFGQKWFVRTGKQTTNLASINKGVLSRFPVLVAPPQEQRRIVAKIEELFSDLDAGGAALRRAKANLKRYRASVLKAAVEGRLTDQWRAEHPPTETASQLLERILKERRRKWGEAQLAAYAKAGKKPPANWKQKYQEPVGPGEAGLPALPESWCWASVEQLLTEGSCNGISVKGSNAPPGVPALRLSAMGESGFDYTDRRYIPISDGIAKALSIKEGDFFVARGNGSLHLVGRGTLAQSPTEQIVFPDTMIRLRFPTPFVIRKYVGRIWPSRLLRRQIEKKARTTAGIYKISQRDIDGFVVPLPPLSEQEQIVAELERRLSVIQEADAQIEANLKRSARLRQSILKRAFEGNLVPQDPTDDPASVLLELLRASRASQANRGRSAATRTRDRKKTEQVPEGRYE
jgi:type I restriction enzyme, S subunit